MSLLSLSEAQGGELTCPRLTWCEHNKHDTVSVKLNNVTLDKQVYRDTEDTEDYSRRWCSRESKQEVVSEEVTFAKLEVLLQS